ncbi:MAG: VWA domain-containing protein [Pirellulaceae bacterium]|nr:VWA domain-containing protein [Pirellulaceae bacterium]MDG2104040.1 VWA domain-containing protein [Pirellulaceae bacterium]
MQNIITSSPLVWAGLLAGMVLLPVLIHLINRLRHKRVSWAAMDFLLTSHKKNRNWVWLKQLLLLLARIACLLLLLLSIGQVGCDSDGMARFLGGRVTHHYIIVDDSLSMNEMDSGQTALQHAKDTVGLIGGRMAGADNQRVTLLRFSQTQHALSSPDTKPTEETDDTSMADLNGLLVDREIERNVLEATDRIQPTFIASRPQAVLELVGDLIQKRPNENSVIYVISDFRKSDWSEQNALTEIFEELSNSGAVVNLIRCADQSSNNVAITAVRPAGNVRVAGVPLMMEVQVTNFGDELVRKTRIALKSATYPDESLPGNKPDDLALDLKDLPTILIDEMEPGETVSRRFPVLFSNPGQHAIRASLEGDSLPADNAHWAVVEFLTSQKILVVDATDSQDGRFLSLAMSPGGMTGLQMEQVSKSKLRDETVAWLEQYDSIFLLDIGRLETSVINKLREYVEVGGGGLVFFAGPNTNLQHYTTDLYDNGKGIYPLPLARAASIPEQLGEASSDFSPQRHPIFASVMDIDFSPLDLVQISQVVKPPPEWSEQDNNAVAVLATVRGDQNAPLVVEKTLGKGTVLAVTTSAGPQWNNWMRNPTFPTTLLLVQDYVSRGKNSMAAPVFVGQRVAYEWDVANFRPDIEFVSPVNAEEGFGFDRTSWGITGVVDERAGNPAMRQAALGQSLDEVDQPGVYERWMVSNNGDRDLKRFPVNVDNSESRPELASRGELLAIAKQAKVEGWQNFTPGPNNNRGTSLVRVLLGLLVLFLLMEQLLARSASFHPKNHSQKTQVGPQRKRYRGQQPQSRGA